MGIKSPRILHIRSSWKSHFLRKEYPLSAPTEGTRNKPTLPTRMAMVMKPNILRMTTLLNVIELIDKTCLWDNVGKLVIKLEGTSEGLYPPGGLIR
jgi:hypothetical protein